MTIPQIHTPLDLPEVREAASEIAKDVAERNKHAKKRQLSPDDLPNLEREYYELHKRKNDAMENADVYAASARAQKALVNTLVTNLSDLKKLPAESMGGIRDRIWRCEQRLEAERQKLAQLESHIERKHQIAANYEKLLKEFEANLGSDLRRLRALAKELDSL